MNLDNIKNFKGGWFIGDFEPSILKTQGFEVALKFHKKNENWPAHYHKMAEEINVLVNGVIKINGILINPGDIFVIEKEEIVKCEFLSDCNMIVVKIPSILNDKYEV